MKTQLQLSAAAVRAYCIRPIKGACNAPLQWTFALLLAIIIPQPSIFAQTDGGTFTDPRDGEKYKTVIMPDGKRWMAENLRHRNGLNNPVFSNIPASSTNTFTGSKNLYYCPGPGPMNASVNQADPLACEYWGALYPFWVAYANAANTAVNTVSGEQGICPDGWHLPSDGEWNLLFTNMGGATDAGRLLKDTARGIFANNQAWKRYWTNAALQNTNSYGFSALAAGLRTTAGAYSGNGTQALFWTSTPNTNGTQASSKIFTSSSDLGAGSSTQNRADALSVRCVEGSCDEGLRLSTRTNCPCFVQTDSIIYDTIDYLRSTTSWMYRLRINTSSAGIWRYNIAIISNPTTNGPSNLTIRKTITTRIAFDTIVEFLIKNIDILNDNGKTLEFLLTATNSNYCSQSQRLFITLKQYTGTTMTDPRDGKTYKTTFLPMDNSGTMKEWMAENLDYRGHGSNTFTFKPTPGGGGSRSYWCQGLDNTSTATTSDDCDKFGAFYTWDCAMWLDGNSSNGAIGGTFPNNNNITTSNSQVGGRGICPTNWHIPTDYEWGLMLNALELTSGNSISGLINSGNPLQGSRDHNAGTSDAIWQGTSAGSQLESCFFGGDDKYSFSARGAGYVNTAVFMDRGGRACFWSSSGRDSSNAWDRELYFGNTFVRRTSLGRYCGSSIRCVKN